MNSLVIPVYKNEANLDRLLAELVKLAGRVNGELGSGLRRRWQSRPLPADSARKPALASLAHAIALAEPELRILRGDRGRAWKGARQLHGRHGGGPSGTAGTGAAVLRGADAGRADIVFGVRGRRSDPWLSEFASNMFWFVYRKLVVKDMPRGRRRYLRLHAGGARPPAAASGYRFEPDRPVVLARLPPRVYCLRTPATAGG